MKRSQLVDKPVIVTWLDACEDPGDKQVPDDLDMGISRRSVGWCVKFTKRGIWIAVTDDRDNASGDHSNMLAVPTAYITHVIPLTRGKRLRPKELKA